MEGAVDVLGEADKGVLQRLAAERARQQAADGERASAEDRRARQQGRTLSSVSERARSSRDRDEFVVRTP
ncbi:MAG: hypothetical protein ABIR67_14700 [Gaiellaceae bacterium]